MNQELFKAEAAANRAHGAWDRQMKRDGHLKRESRDISNCNPEVLSPVARAFYKEYMAALDSLQIAAGQGDLFEQGDNSGGKPALTVHENKASGKTKKDLPVVTKFPNPDDVGTPEGLTRKIVTPDTLAELRAASAAESLAKDKPTGKVMELDGRHWVVVEVSENYVVVNLCVPEDVYEGDTIASIEGREPDDWAGLLFKSGRGATAANYVLANAAQSMACLAGDPLADKELQTGTGS